MENTAPQVKLAPFHFVNRSAVPWWKSGKMRFQEDIVPIEAMEAPTGIVKYKKSKEAPTGVVEYKSHKMSSRK